MKNSSAKLPNFEKPFCLFADQLLKKFKMSSLNSNIKEEIVGEKYLGESSFHTPKPSTPDTYFTSSLSCASRDEAILRGGFKMETCQGVPQLTLGLIKPDGMEFLEEIEMRMKKEGFDIVRSRTLQLSPEEASSFYYEHYGEPYFPLLVTNMCEGPIKVYILHRKDAVPMWKLLCGPTSVNHAKIRNPESLRALYGTPGKNFKNVCHACKTEERAREEIGFFFPETILDENFRSYPDVQNYIKDFVYPTLLEGLIELCKNKPLDPLQWLGEWLLMNNPNKPKMLREIAITPT